MIDRFFSTVPVSAEIHGTLMTRIRLMNADETDERGAE